MPEDILHKIRRFMPEGLEDFLAETGSLGLFAGRFFKDVFSPPFELREVIRQCYQVGVKSLPLVAITGFIMGLVLALQSRPTLVEFGAESWLPSMISISIIREIGPVITALICAGKVGSGMGAEIASMRVTEQIDAMEVSGTNPFKYIVVTRVLATTLMIPVLVIFSDAISFFGAYVAANIAGNISFVLFFNQAFDALAFYDLMPSTIKTFFFGFAVGIISCHKGYFSNAGTEGVGRAANSAVVLSSLVVFLIDMLAVQLTNILTDIPS